MVKIRLKRMGSKKSPHYRIVVMPARSPRDGRPVERLGHYDPRVDPPVVVVDTDVALKWLDRGARPTDIVRNIFRKAGVLRAWTEKQVASVETTE